MAEKTKAEIKEKFDQPEFRVHVIGRHVAITDAMKNYAMEKLKKIERLNSLRILDVYIIMDVQKLLHTADFILNVNNTRIKVSGRSESMYASIDQSIAHLDAKLKRYLRRLHEHQARHLSIIDMNVNVVQRINPIDDINDQIEEANFKRTEEDLRPHQVASRETKPLKTLNQEEAIMKMELSEDQFMIYRCEEDQKLKVIYRRNDGNYGIIEPEK
jgi:putative sigma-54 modulation protein